MSFLTAEWRKLALANYLIDPEVLKPFVPQHTELDLWKGQCMVSLVGFMFLDTKLLGLPIPFHRNFEEVNLRFYVKYRDGATLKRGVVFIKELVPKPALSWVANTLYKEHYQSLPMKHNWAKDSEALKVSYSWKLGKRWNSFTLEALPNSIAIDSDSEAEFITEHYWGYTRVSDTATFEYEVTHPTWRVYPITSYRIDVDFEQVYGPSFAFLNDATPHSCQLAEGSIITVENKRRLPCT